MNNFLYAMTESFGSKQIVIGGLGMENLQEVFGKMIPGFQTIFGSVLDYLIWFCCERNTDRGIGC